MALREELQSYVNNWEAIGQPALWERFILRNGKPYACRMLPSHDRGPVGHCFSNAGDRFRRLKGVYVEGLALTKGLIPIHHAWVGVGEQAYEVTWGPRLLSGKPRETKYLGIPLTEDQRIDGIAETGTYSAFSTGVTWNTDLMFSIDPELEEIVAKVREAGVRQPATSASAEVSPT